jgi:hypothetical protein
MFYCDESFSYLPKKFRGFPIFKIVTVTHVQGVSEIHGSTTGAYFVHKNSETLLCK